MAKKKRNRTKTDRRKAELLALRAENQRLRDRHNAVAMENWSVITAGGDDVEAVNPWDWWAPEFTGQQFGTYVPMSRTDDRRHGENPPTVETQQDLEQIRGIARYLCDHNCAGIGAVGNLKNYVVGDGYVLGVQARRRQKVPQELLDACEEVIEDVLEENDWTDSLDRELFGRGVRDGEFFLACFPQRSGFTKLRVVEPEQVPDPGDNGPSNQGELLHRFGVHPNVATNWRLGVHKSDHDCCEVWGYHVVWAQEEGSDYLPADVVIHHKRNVDRSAARGQSDFTPAWRWLNEQERVLRRTGRGAALQASIAWFVKHAQGVTQGQVEDMRANNAAYRVQARNPGGSYETIDVERYGDGLVVDHGGNSEVEAGPSGQRGVQFIDVSAALLRYVAVRWAMPEYMISSDASNSNYASTVEAGTPWFKAVEGMQGDFRRPIIEMCRHILRNAANAGLFQKRFGIKDWAALRRLVRPVVTPPEIESRDPLQGTQRRVILREQGVISQQTFAAEEGYDETERERVEEEAAQQQQGGAAGNLVAGLLARSKGAQKPGDEPEGGSDSDGGQPRTPPVPQPPGPTAAQNAGLPRPSEGAVGGCGANCACEGCRNKRMAAEADGLIRGRMALHGLVIGVEHPKGSTRKGTRPDGSEWSRQLSHDYGHIMGSRGTDGDSVDVFIGPDPEVETAFVVDQVDKDGNFDEHKVLLGFKNQDEAVAGYKSNYDDGWKVGPVTPMSIDQLTRWLHTADQGPAAGRRLDAVIYETAVAADRAVVMTAENDLDDIRSSPGFEQLLQDADDIQQIGGDLNTFKETHGGPYGFDDEYLTEIWNEAGANAEAGKHADAINAYKDAKSMADVMAANPDDYTPNEVTVGKEMAQQKLKDAIAAGVPANKLEPDLDAQQASALDAIEKSAQDYYAAGGVVGPDAKQKAMLDAIDKAHTLGLSTESIVAAKDQGWQNHEGSKPQSKGEALANVAQKMADYHTSGKSPEATDAVAKAMNQAEDLGAGVEELNKANELGAALAKVHDASLAFHADGTEANSVAATDALQAAQALGATNDEINANYSAGKELASALTNEPDQMANHPGANLGWGDIGKEVALEDMKAAAKHYAGVGVTSIAQAHQEFNKAVQAAKDAGVPVEEIKEAIKAGGITSPLLLDKHPMLAGGEGNMLQDAFDDAKKQEAIDKWLNAAPGSGEAADAADEAYAHGATEADLEAAHIKKEAIDKYVEASFKEPKPTAAQMSELYQEATDAGASVAELKAAYDAAKPDDTAKPDTGKPSAEKLEELIPGFEVKYLTEPGEQEAVEKLLHAIMLNDEDVYEAAVAHLKELGWADSSIKQVTEAYQQSSLKQNFPAKDGTNCGTGAGGFQPGNWCGANATHAKKTSAVHKGWKSQSLVDVSDWPEKNSAAKGANNKIAKMEALAAAGKFDEIAALKPYGHGGGQVNKYGKAANAVQDALLEHHETSTAPPVPPPPEAKPGGILDMKDWVKIGGQKGGQEGALYQDPATGKKWYVKPGDTEDRVHQEVLGAQLIAATGVNIPNVQKAKNKDGTLAVASEWIDGLGNKMGLSPTPQQKAEAKKQFAVHAWLGNWDAVGLTGDNIEFDANGNAYAIEAGGTLEYRAGGMKKQFGPVVTEWDTMRDPSVANEAGPIFKDMTPAELIASAAKVEGLSNPKIKEIVATYGPTDPDQNAKLAQVLIDRRNHISDKVEKLGGGPVIKATVGAPVPAGGTAKPKTAPKTSTKPKTPGHAPAAPTPAVIPTPPPSTTTTNPSYQKKVDKLYAAATSSTDPAVAAAAVDAIKTSATTKNTYGKKAHKYKNELLQALGSSGGHPMPAAPKPKAKPKPQKKTVTADLLPDDPEFISSNAANVAQNESWVPKIKAAAMGSDHDAQLAALQAIGPQLPPSPKLKGYHGQVMTAVQDAKAWLPPPEPITDTVAQVSAQAKLLMTPKAKAAAHKIGHWLVIGDVGGPSANPKHHPGGKGKKADMPQQSDSMHTKGKKAWQKVPGGTTGYPGSATGQAAAVRDFTGSWQHIKQPQLHGTKSKDADLALLGAAKAAIKLPTGRWLRRGVELSSYMQAQLKAATGKVIQDPSLQSSANDLHGFASSANTQFRIVPGEGAKAAPADHWSKNQGENEFILPANSRYWIQDTHEDGGQLFVDVVLLPFVPAQMKPPKAKAGSLSSAQKAYQDKMDQAHQDFLSGKIDAKPTPPS